MWFPPKPLGTLLALLRQRYFQVIGDAQSIVSDFIIETQKIAQQKPYTQSFLAGIGIHPSALGRALDFAYFIKDIVADRGWSNFFKIVLKRIRSGRISFIKS